MSKKTSVWILIGIMLLSVLNFVFWAEQKEGYHMDEIYSFGLANSQFHYNIHDDEGNFRWNTAEDMDEYLTVTEKHRFDYANVCKNQAEDVHPPLFYAFMHTVASFFPNTVSVYFAVFPNILFALATLIFIYLLSMRIFRRRSYSLLAVAIYAFSFGCVNMVIFSRMYSQLSFFSTAILYVHFLLRDREYKFSPGLAVSYAILLFAGSLTQYYFFIFMAILAGITVIDMLIKKKTKSILFYIGLTLVVAGIYAVVWPPVFPHLLSSSRGQEALSNATSSPWAWNFIAYIYLIRESLGTVFFFILLAALIIFVGKSVKEIAKKGSSPRDICIRHNDILIVSLVLLFFTLIVAKVAPYQTPRYITPAIPLSAIVFVYGFSYFVRKIQACEQKRRKLLAWITSIVMVIGLTSALYEGFIYERWNNWPISVRYPISSEMEQVFEEYDDTRCVMVYSYYEQYLWNFQDYKNFKETAFVAKNKTDKFFKKNPMNEDEQFLLCVGSGIDADVFANETAEKLGFKCKLIIDTTWRTFTRTYLLYK